MGFTEAIKTCYTKSFTCKGRAPRSEFWYFYLFQVCLVIIWFVSAGITSSNTPQNIANDGTPVLLITIYGITYLTTIPASFCATIRRLHDVNKSGWVCLLCFVPLGGFVLLYFLCQPSTWTNEYGKAPLESGFYGNGYSSAVRQAEKKTTQQVPPFIPTSVPPQIPITEYFVVINNRQVGPLHLQDIKRMLQDGQVNHQTLIWKQGMSDWGIIGNLQEL